MPDSLNLKKNGVNRDNFIKIVLVIGVILILGSFLNDLFGIFGPHLEMRKNLNELKKSLSEAKSNIDYSRLQLDSIVKEINTCNMFIDSVKLRVELIDRSLIKESEEFVRASREQKAKLENMRDSLRKVLNENKIGIPTVVDP
jgi:regulator of replication initiation timing